MTRLHHFLGGLLAAAIIAFAVMPASMAQSLVLDQTPAPSPSATVQGTGNSEVYNQLVTVPGGALYQSFYRQPGPGGIVVPLGQTFVAGGGGSIARFLDLTNGKSDPGIALTATPGTPTGAPGVSRTAGTSLVLTGEATSSSAKTNKVIWEFNLPSTYVAGANIPVVVNANYTGSGTITAASTTIAAQIYTETAGVEAAVTTSAAQQFSGTATNYTFTVTGTGLTPGQHCVVEITMLVTSASGANTGQINAVSYTS